MLAVTLVSSKYAADLWARPIFYMGSIRLTANTHTANTYLENTYMAADNPYRGIPTHKSTPKSSPALQ